ncbi:MAG: hypothetical protein EPO57_03505 [Chitinophagaceae bacterium]|nr:MAG: hypothetical protein EPO57_03505 [Chitinophagaceae bacterium]
MWLSKFVFITLLSLLFCNTAFSQYIVYSEPEKDDSRKMDFEIIGKFDGNFLVYKNVRGNNFICVYDKEMKQITKVEQSYMPTERLINVDFFAYSNFSYMIYQYQKRNVVYCMVVKLDAMGKNIADPMELDTAIIGLATNNKIYTAITSEDKQKIIVFKINSKNRDKFIISTKLFDNKLERLHQSSLSMPMNEYRDYLGEFVLDNGGNLAFVKYYRISNESISAALIVSKKAMEDSFVYHSVQLNKIYLDELRLKADNFNNRFLLSAFYYKQKRGAIEGIYFYGVNKNTGEKTMETQFLFGEDIRREANRVRNIKMAFNDYFIRNLILKKDGGFIVDMEAYYTSSKANVWDRMNYLYGSPYSSPYDYYFYSPYNNSRRWRSDSKQALRYHADNMVILSFDKSGDLLWSNVINKEQFDDEDDDRISYQVMNTGGQLHFLFNQYEKRNLLLNDYTLLPNGEVNRNSTLKNLNLGHEFMPKYGKQISAQQMIMPCIFRNYICFAKIDFN